MKGKNKKVKFQKKCKITMDRNYDDESLSSDGPEKNRYAQVIRIFPSHIAPRVRPFHDDQDFHQIQVNIEETINEIVSKSYKIKWQLCDLFRDSQIVAAFYDSRDGDALFKNDRLDALCRFEKRRVSDYVRHVTEIYNFFNTFETYFDLDN